MQAFFEFGLGTRVLYGVGLACECAQEIERLGAQRVLLVTDAGIATAGLLEPIQASLSSAGTHVAIFDQVPANSSVQMVAEGAALAREQEIDLLVAVGGGSPLDTAKCMRILLTHGGDLLDYQGYNVLEQPLLPMIAIPTTAGTGSEVSPFAVIRDETTQVKLTFASPFLAPTLALLDPELTRTLPATLTAATALDTLTHAIETIASSDSNPISDSLALAAIERVAHHLRDALLDGANMVARGNLLLASCMAGIAFSSGFLGVVHALAHATGGKFCVHHGMANALFLPHGMQFNAAVVPERYVKIAQALGVPGAGRSQAEVIADGIAAVRTLCADAGMPNRLRDLNIPEAALEELAEIALTDAAIFTNPRSATQEELLELLRAAW
jgi:alcohol dehydrogenase